MAHAPPNTNGRFLQMKEMFRHRNTPQSHPEMDRVSEVQSGLNIFHNVSEKELTVLLLWRFARVPSDKFPFVAIWHALICLFLVLILQVVKDDSDLLHAIQVHCFL